MANTAPYMSKVLIYAKDEEKYLSQFENYFCKIQKQPSGGVLRKRCSENMQQSFRRTAMRKCDVNKAAKQLIIFG